MSSVIKLRLLGQSVWYDNVERGLIKDNALKGRIERREIYGVTSNPSIFQAAIVKTNDYDSDLQTMSWAGLSPRDIFYRLAIQDIQDVADLFRPYYDASCGKDGFVSLEVDPFLAHDTQGTLQEAQWLWREVARPNLMVKIPATIAGLPAVTEAIADGINVNITLIFSRKRYAEVMDAFLLGLEKRLAAGKDISQISSVASFFVSRLESKADERLKRIVDEGGARSEQASQLLGKIAVDNTRLAYKLFEEYFNSERFCKLQEHGAQKQRPLWASTSTKDPAYNDIKYVSELIAENTVNTLPPDTLDAFLDHGDPKITIYDDFEQAEKDFEKLAALGISLDDITQELEDEGVQKFAESFQSLLNSIEIRREKFRSELGLLQGALDSEIKAFEKEDMVARIFKNDPTVWTKSPEGKAEIQKRLGWLRLPSESQSFIPKLERFAEECRKEGLEKVLLLGMGGSSLAPETIYLALSAQTKGMALRILDSTVQGQISAAEDWADLEKTLFIVASKSGTTSETLSLFHYFWAKSEKVLGNQRGSHFVAISDPGTPLVDLGEFLGFRAVFTADSNVGGRYSALTHFGLVPAALMGVDLKRFLSRAEEIAEKCHQSGEIALNPGALLGVIFGLAEKNAKDKLTILADDEIASLAPWMEQLVAESSGKEGRGIVPIADEPLMDAGSYGVDRIFVYLRKSGEMDPFVEDLRSAGQIVVVLTVEDLYSIAAQFYLWEFAVGVACSVIGVNAFDQPDVQDNKNRTKEKIARYLEAKKLDEPQVIWEKDGIQLFGTDFAGFDSCLTISEVIDRFIGSSKDGDYIAINAYVPRNDDTISKLTDLRRHILEQTNRATTLGFGPRFLHSTGQLHKGGANNGLFIQITQGDRDDLDIPGMGYSFGVLARAQAQGDLEALLARDRRAIRIHLPADHPFEFGF